MAKLIWVGRINCREIRILHRIVHTVDTDCFFIKINFIQKQAVFHFKFRSAHDDLAFKLKLYDGDGLVHLHVKRQILGIVIGVVFDIEYAAVNVLVLFHGKGGKRD